MLKLKQWSLSVIMVLFSVYLYSGFSVLFLAALFISQDTDPTCPLPLQPDSCCFDLPIKLKGLPSKLRQLIIVWTLGQCQLILVFKAGMMGAVTVKALVQGPARVMTVLMVNNCTNRNRLSL